jgi:hypothetical protein
VTGGRTLSASLAALRAVAVRAADDIVARSSDGSFLERVLRDALASRLENGRTEQSLGLDGGLWPGRLGGVDVLYVERDGSRVGVETKVWDVADSLYDLIKLAAGTQRGTIVSGFCVVAGRTRDWRSISAIRALSVAPHGAAIRRDVAAMLRDHRSEWARIWSRAGIRPTAVPAHILTTACEPIPMPRVPDHEVRLIGVQAADREQLRLDPAGNPG